MAFYATKIASNEIRWNDYLSSTNNFWKAFLKIFFFNKIIKISKKITVLPTHMPSDFIHVDTAHWKYVVTLSANLNMFISENAKLFASLYVISGTIVGSIAQL